MSSEHDSGQCLALRETTSHIVTHVFRCEPKEICSELCLAFQILLLICYFTFVNPVTPISCHIRKKNKKLRLNSAAQMRKEDNGWKIKVKFWDLYWKVGKESWCFVFLPLKKCLTWPNTSNDLALFMFWSFMCNISSAKKLWF